MSQAIGNTALAYARVWHHVDATDRVLGNLAERIAIVLMGKHKPIHDKSVDCGDYVVVTNARSIHVSGRKREQKLYRSHSMYPGGLKEIVFKDMQEKKPHEIIRHAVAGMLPKNKLRDRRLERLKIFAGEEIGVYRSNILRRWEDGTLDRWEKGRLVGKGSWQPGMRLKGLAPVDTSSTSSTPPTPRL